jgi:hypothetical protein
MNAKLLVKGCLLNALLFTVVTVVTGKMLADWNASIPLICQLCWNI